jgi:hypothetical protein
MNSTHAAAVRSTRTVRHAVAAMLVACAAVGCESDGRPVASKPGTTKSSVTKSRPNWESSPGAVRGDSSPCESADGDRALPARTLSE